MDTCYVRGVPTFAFWGFSLEELYTISKSPIGHEKKYKCNPKA